MLTERSSAPLIITRLPTDEDTEAKAYKLASRAKAAQAAAGYMVADEANLRAALALIHMVELLEEKRPTAMAEAHMLVGLLAASFTDHDEAPDRVALLSQELPDPTSVLQRAVSTNRRLLGLDAES